MSRLNTRTAGAWAPSSSSGAARVAGAWVPFGPDVDPGDTYERVTWPAPPSSTDLVDGSSLYNMGLRFALVAPQACAGITWRAPDTTPDPPGGHLASVWNWDTGVRLASKAFTPTPGVDQDVVFDSPLSLTTGVNYAAAVYTGHYVFHTGTWNVTTPSGNAQGDRGVLVADAGADAFPDDLFNSWYYVGPLMVAA